MMGGGGETKLFLPERIMFHLSPQRGRERATKKLFLGNDMVQEAIPSCQHRCFCVVVGMRAFGKKKVVATTHDFPLIVRK